MMATLHLRCLSIEIGTPPSVEFVAFVHCLKVVMEMPNTVLDFLDK